MHEYYWAKHTYTCNIKAFCTVLQFTKSRLQMQYALHQPKIKVLLPRLVHFQLPETSWDSFTSIRIFSPSPNNSPVAQQLDRIIRQQPFPFGEQFLPPQLYHLRHWHNPTVLFGKQLRVYVFMQVFSFVVDLKGSSWHIASFVLKC